MFFYRVSPLIEGNLDFEAASGWPATMTDFDMIGTLTTVSHSDSPRFPTRPRRGLGNIRV